MKLFVSRLLPKFSISPWSICNPSVDIEGWELGLVVSSVKSPFCLISFVFPELFNISSKQKRPHLFLSMSKQEPKQEESVQFFCLLPIDLHTSIL